jgi:hypothetical protein
VKFALRFPFVADQPQQANNEDLIGSVNEIGQFIFRGTGAPTFTPPGPALYFREDFAVNTAVYSYDGSWKSVT